MSSDQERSLCRSSDRFLFHFGSAFHRSAGLPSLPFPLRDDVLLDYLPRPSGRAAGWRWRSASREKKTKIVQVENASGISPNPSRAHPHRVIVAPPSSGRNLRLPARMIVRSSRLSTDGRMKLFRPLATPIPFAGWRLAPRHRPRPLSDDFLMRGLCDPSRRARSPLFHASSEPLLRFRSFSQLISGSRPCPAVSIR